MKEMAKGFEKMSKEMREGCEKMDETNKLIARLIVEENEKNKERNP